ncbi:MAG: sensor domain-containing diguanylate cyclase [Gammaproteobacteria bacterium]|nr:sensor domain-containing diguanylate cyclase [Gammaproteobacteria bacterium]
MKKPNLPADEAARLATLAALNILDTDPEERFDRYTRLAKKIFKVPISLISLIDQDRQWFKARLGLEATETPREVSFCGHAILGDETFVIKDAKADKRFADNPLVTQDPNIRFYAGRPIKAPDGNRIGTLCVIDQTPRDFDEEDLAALDDLAQLVESEFKITVETTTDELTGLTNRRGFRDIAKHVLTVCERTGIPASLLYFEIDNIKSINDKLGRQQSDRAIFEFAKILLDTFRISDIIARLGGDEFCVLLTGTDKTATMIPLNRLYALLDEFNARDSSPFELDISYGMVNYDRNQHHNISDLLVEADTLMYVHKKMRKTRN